MPGYYKRRPELKSLVTSYEDCPVEIKKSEYMEITKGFMKFIMEKIHDGETVTLPAGMGQVEIVGQKKRIKIDEDGEIYGLPTNWPETFKLWNSDPDAKKQKKLIYIFNEHSAGIRYKFRWTKYRVAIPFCSKRPYTFRATRDNRRRLYKAITESNKEYRIVDFYNKTNARTTQLINQKKKRNGIHNNGHSIQQSTEGLARNNN